MKLFDFSQNEMLKQLLNFLAVLANHSL